MYSVQLQNNRGTMLFSKHITLIEAKEFVSEKFNNDYQGNNFNCAEIYDQETTLSIKRTKGKEWSNWFSKYQ